MAQDLDDLIRRALESGDRDGDPWWRAVDGLRAGDLSAGLERALALAVEAEAAARALACDALGQIGGDDEALGDRLIPVLITALDDPDPVVRSAAAVALSHQRDPRVIGPLAGRRADSDAEVRHAVAFGLGGFEDPVAIDTLVELTRDARPAVRDWATFALGSLTTVTTPAIVAALLERLSDPDEQTREEAVVGIVERAGDGRVLSGLAVVLGARGSVGRGPLEAAARIGDPRLLPALLQVSAASDTERLLLEHAIYACSPQEDEEGGVSAS